MVILLLCSCYNIILITNTVINVVQSASVGVAATGECGGGCGEPDLDLLEWWDTLATLGMTRTRETFTTDLLLPECSVTSAAEELDNLLTVEPLNLNPPSAPVPPGDGKAPPSRGVDVIGALVSKIVG